ncbi:MAG: hypothetical protein AAB372_04460 [Patescibacteria group bacterium]
MKNLILLLLLIGAACGVYFIALPAWNRIAELRAQIAEVDNVRTRIEEVRDQRDKLVDRFNAVDANALRRLDKMFPTSISQEEVYVFFEEIARRTGMGMKTLALTPDSGAAKTPDRKAMQFRVSVSGPYSNVRVFLNTVENNIRLMDITAIDVVAKPDGGFDVNMQGLMYYGGK